MLGLPDELMSRTRHTDEDFAIRAEIVEELALLEQGCLRVSLAPNNQCWSFNSRGGILVPVPQGILNRGTPQLGVPPRAPDRVEREDTRPDRGANRRRELVVASNLAIPDVRQ